VSILIQDLALSVRQLWRRPAFTLTAVLTLAIGMGVNAVAFTVVNGLLFKRPVVSAGDDVGRIATTPGGDESGYASLMEYQRFADATRGVLDLAAEGRLAMALRHQGTTRTVWVLFVSANYFSMVNVRPIAGRIDVARAAGDVPAVVIGERFWRDTLSAAALTGLTLRLNDADVSVGGVLPESFTGPAGIYSPDVWLPLEDLALFSTSPALRKRDHRWLFLLGRVRPGVGIPEVQGHVDAAVAAMANDWPDSHRQRGARFRLLKDGNSELRGLTTAAAIAMGLIGLALLLACFNVANLLLARAVERERDMAIRAAIGAGTMRLTRLVVTDGFVIASLAGVAALLVAWWTQSLVGSFAIPIEQPQHIELNPDANVVTFVVALVVIAGVLPGLWPALSTARVDVSRVLGSRGGNSAGGRPSPVRRWLVGAQIAGSTALLAIAALIAQTYGNLAAADLGFAKDTLVIAEFQPAAHGYDAARSERYVEALLARVRALPGVTDVAVADRVPFFIGFERLTPVASGDATCAADACPKYPTLAVGPGYFKTMGIALSAGREFEASGAPAAVIINQPLAKQQWRDGRGIGETLRIGDRGVPVTVIGITAKTHTRGTRSRRAHAPRSPAPRTLRRGSHRGRSYGDGARTRRAAVRRGHTGARHQRPDAGREDDAATPGGTAMAVPHGRLALFGVRRARPHPRYGWTGWRDHSRRQPPPQGIWCARLARRNTPRPRLRCPGKQRDASVPRPHRGRLARGRCDAAASSSVLRCQRPQPAHLSRGWALPMRDCRRRLHHARAARREGGPACRPSIGIARVIRNAVRPADRRGWHDTPEASRRRARPSQVRSRQPTS
jgi:predicted permease